MLRLIPEPIVSSPSDDKGSGLLLVHVVRVGARSLFLIRFAP